MRRAHKFLLLLLRMIVMTLAVVGALQKFAMVPQDQTAVVGSRLTLPCRVIDRSGPVLWAKDGFMLGEDRDVSAYDRYSVIGSDEEGDFSLDIYPVMPEDGARYQCNVLPGFVGDLILRSHFATVTVLVPMYPLKIYQGEFLETTEDWEIKLICINQDRKPATEITWIDGMGNVLTEGIEYIVDELSDGRRFTAKSILKFTPRKQHHNTTITCQAPRTAEWTYRSAQLDLAVRYAPKVTVSIISGAACNGRIPEGAEVHLGCMADANPAEVTYRWFLNDELLIGDYTTELVLHNVSKKHHDAIVKCEVHNSVGKSEESETLDISYGPQFRSMPRSIQADLGASVTLTCDVDGNPFPDISWYLENSTKIISTHTNLTLRVDTESAGRYFCKAHVPGFQDIGAEAAIYLKVVPSAGPPSDAPPSIVDSQPVSQTFIIIGVIGIAIFISIIGIAIFISIIGITIYLFQRQGNKKKPPEGNDSNVIEKQCKESGRSSNISDLNIDPRTGSSNSNMHCDMDYIPGAESETGSESVITRIGVPLAGPVNVPGQEIYRYSAEYTEPTFPPKDGQNNNSYVPYVDQVPAELCKTTKSLCRGPLAMSYLTNLHIATSQSMGNGNPYLRIPSLGLPTPNTANPAATLAPPTTPGTPPGI